MPPMPQNAPTPAESSIMCAKLLVSSLATMGGMTMAAAIIVTPSTWIDTTMVAASTRASMASTQPVGTP